MNKQDILNKYGGRAADPYYYCFGVLVSRFIYFLNHAPGDKKGIILYESRRNGLDRVLEKRYSELINDGILKLNGEVLVSSDDVQNRIKGIVKLDKPCNSVGIQFSDLCATSISRKIKGLPDNFIKYDIIKTKIRSLGGTLEGYGIINCT